MPSVCLPDATAQVWAPMSDDHLMHQLHMYVLAEQHL